MEALPHHLHRLTSRFYHQYPNTLRISTNYLQELIPRQNPNYLQQYVSYYHEPLVPLDLSLKSTTPITPPCTPPPLSKTKAKENSENVVKNCKDPIDKTSENDENIYNQKKLEENSNDSDSPEAKKLKFTKQFFDELQTCLPKDHLTPSKSERSTPEVLEVKDVKERPKKSPPKLQPFKKSKAVRKLTFDEDTTSPVSGTIIRELGEDETLVVRKVSNSTAY